MKKLTASVLGLDTFNEGKMDEFLEKAVVLNGEITFHFKDGHMETRQYRERKRGTRHSEAYRAYMHEIMQYAKRKDPEAKKIMLALKEEWKREDNRWKKQ